MRRITVASMPAAGHVNPNLPLVSELVRRDVEVTYYTDEVFGPAVERAGARWRPYPAGTISAQAIAEATRSGGPLGVIARALPVVEALVSHLTQRLTAEPADAVAYDSNAVWGRIAAASIDLPKISLMTTLMLTAADYRRLTVREWAASLPATLRDMPRLLVARRRLLRRIGKDLYPPPPTLPMRGDVTILPIPRELQAPHPLLDDSWHFVGPLIDTAARGGTIDAELASHLDGPDPVVLVSLGTLHAGTDAFFRSCLQVLAGLPVRGILVVGPYTDPTSLGTPPANVLVRSSIPQLEVLARAAAFVTHGGMNSVLEALAAQVPLVVVPQQIEQLVIGSAVADRGAASVLRQHLANRPVPPAELRAAITRALSDPAQRHSAAAMARTLSAGGGAAAAASAIEDLLRSRG